MVHGYFRRSEQKGTGLAEKEVNGLTFYFPRLFQLLMVYFISFFACWIYQAVCTNSRICGVDRV
jgi:hypothetical protein